jgi:hypothetical protein
MLQVDFVSAREKNGGQKMERPTFARGLLDRPEEIDKK